MAFDRTGVLAAKPLDPRFRGDDDWGGSPLVPTSDGVAEPRNRRLEIIVR